MTTIPDRIQTLFRDHWSRLKRVDIEPTPQPGGGADHRCADIEPYRHLLTDGWDTPVSVLRDYGQAHGLTVVGDGG